MVAHKDAWMHSHTQTHTCTHDSLQEQVFSHVWRGERMVGMEWIEGRWGEGEKKKAVGSGENKDESDRGKDDYLWGQ